MKQYEPVLIKPLKFRGIFGITWVIYKRGFLSMLIFTFLLSSIVMLFTGALGLRNFDMLDRLQEMPNFGFDFDLQGLSASGKALGAPALPGNFGWMFDAMISGLIFTVLADLVGLVNLLVLQPIYQSSVYTEMSRRIYGEASDLRTLLRRCGFMLKHFFTTYLCYWLVVLGISIVVGLVFMILFFFAAAIAAISFITTSVPVGFIVTMILFVLVFIAAMLIGPMLLSFVFPAAVNENIKNFKAVGRSFKLVGKRFWRVLFANLLVGAVMFLVFAILLIAVLISFLGDVSGPESMGDLKPMFYVIFGVEALISLLLIPYSAALNTVLYFDTRVRTEGEGWLNYAKAEGAEPPVSDGSAVYKEDPAVYENENDTFMPDPEGSEARHPETPEGE